MAYKNYDVDIVFLSSESGSVEYTLPYVYYIDDPEPRNKDVVHHGNRADGSIRIPGGKRSQEITIKGKLYDEDGYEDLEEKIQAMRNAITTDPGTLTIKHREIGGGAFTTDKQYTVFRNQEIEFEQSDRTGIQNYSITFLVLSY